MLPAPPSRRLAIVTCMDARLDLFDAFDLELGEAHILRNAGGLVTDDVLRSLAISQRALDTREIAIVHHTRCGMDGFDDISFRLELAERDRRRPDLGRARLHRPARPGAAQRRRGAQLPLAAAPRRGHAATSTTSRRTSFR